MLNNIINDKQEEASLDFHSYLKTKIQEAVGLVEGEKSPALEKFLDPKINWWDQIDDIKKAFDSNELDEREVDKWANEKIYKNSNVSKMIEFGDGVYLLPAETDYYTEVNDSDEVANFVVMHIIGEAENDELIAFLKKNAANGISLISAYNGGGGHSSEVMFTGCAPSKVKVKSKGLQMHYTRDYFDPDILTDQDRADLSMEEDDELPDDANVVAFANHYFGGLKKFMKDYGVSKKSAESFLDIEHPNLVSVLKTSKGILVAVAEND